MPRRSGTYIDRSEYLGGTMDSEATNRGGDARSRVILQSDFERPEVPQKKDAPLDIGGTGPKVRSRPRGPAREHAKGPSGILARSIS